MDEILSKLLESDLLSEETKNEISESWSEAVEAKRSELREEVALEVRAELAEQFVIARDSLIEKVESFVSEQIEAEFNELRSDIESFRDLEVEFAGKLVEEKQKLAEEVEKEMDTLVDKIDSFLDIRLTEELDEFKEDLEIVKQNEFGRKVFEAFAKEYSKSHHDEDSVEAKLAITESKLADVTKILNEMESDKVALIREQKLQEVLAPLAGDKREQMGFILQNVATEKLEESYKYFIGRILKEEVAPKVIEEEKTTLATGEVISTTTKPVITEASQNFLAEMKRLAGV